jgi:hypothetical protein
MNVLANFTYSDMSVCYTTESDTCMFTSLRITKYEQSQTFDLHSKAQTIYTLRIMNTYLLTYLLMELSAS